MVLALLLVSCLLTLAGSTCAVFAFGATWRAYGGGKAMFPRLAKALLPLQRLAFWRKTQAVQMQGHASMAVTSSLELRRAPPPYPEHGLARTQMAWLRREQEAAAQQLTNLQDALLKSETTLREQIGHSDEEHREAVDATRAMVKDVATGDVPLQVLSLLLISGGAVFGIVASIVAL